MVKYTPPKIDFKKRRKSVAIPDQSLSIQEIVRRYVRGIPVDVVQRQGLYVDQQEHDLEKLSRMDFGEKAEYAAALAEQANRQHNAFQAENDRREAEAKEVQQAAEEQPAPAKKAKPKNPPVKGGE